LVLNDNLPVVLIIICLVWK